MSQVVDGEVGVRAAGTSRVVPRAGQASLQVGRHHREGVPAPTLLLLQNTHVLVATRKNFFEINIWWTHVL